MSQDYWCRRHCWNMADSHIHWRHSHRRHPCIQHGSYSWTLLSRWYTWSCSHMVVWDIRQRLLHSDFLWTLVYTDSHSLQICGYMFHHLDRVPMHTPQPRPTVSHKRKSAYNRTLHNAHMKHLYSPVV